YDESILILALVCFFFSSRRRHTRFSRDWSSDVCSSDLIGDLDCGGNARVRKGLRRSKDQPRAWQRMLSGRRLDLLDPSPMDIEIEDIAHGLARVARWNGQTLGEHGFSVAQHSMVVEEIMAHVQPDIAPRWRLAGLLHDASEYVI